jgi:undecaprenyl-phosphate galactose phosphotransferase
MLRGLSRPEAWRQLMATRKAGHVFLALGAEESDCYRTALKALAQARLPYSVTPSWAGLPSDGFTAQAFPMRDTLLLHSIDRLSHAVPCALKRGFDMLASGAALVALSPLFALLCLLVRRDGGPAFFSQPRVGRDGRKFQCYKFRSMRVDAENYLAQYLSENPDKRAEWDMYQKLKKDVRITRVGHFIRRTSLDELTQLLNVLKGDMSLVGPRPIMPGQESYYAEDFSYYQRVRPGITGPWQVSGRNKLTFDERAQLEIAYVRNWSLRLDMQIILKTIPVLLKKEQAF